MYALYRLWLEAPIHVLLIVSTMIATPWVVWKMIKLFLQCPIESTTKGGIQGTQENTRALNTLDDGKPYSHH